jgi:hypothetical protein
VFTREAVIAVHHAARGLPRTINVICDNALVTGFADNVKPVSGGIIAAVCADFHFAQGPIPTAVASGSPAPLRPDPAFEARIHGEPATGDDPAKPIFDDYLKPKRFSFFRNTRR